METRLKAWFPYRCICRVCRTKKILRTDRIHSILYNKLYTSFLLYWAFVREVSIKLYLSYEFFSYDRYNDMETRLQWGSQWGGPFDGWRLKISRFDGRRLNFRSFDGWRLIFWNDVYNTKLNPNLTVRFHKMICFFSYLNTGFNPIICALKMRLLVFNYGNYVYY